MTSPIFDRCKKVAEEFINIIENDIDGTLRPSIQGNVTDYISGNNQFRRAHISIVDAIKEKNIWLLHVTIFPHIDDGCPIYGFDIVAGPNKVSGAFHDFSSSGHRNNILMRWFGEQTRDISWNKKRELPEWAKNIFSENMVAIGAVGIDELNAFCELGIKTLTYYLENVGCTKSYLHNNIDSQNFYCENQRLNPHTPRVLQSIGFSEEDAKNFVFNNLFPLLEK